MELTEFKHYLTAKGYSKETTESILKATRRFLKWINEQGIEITTINYNDIIAYIKTSQQRAIKAHTVQLMVINIKHYLNYLVEAGILNNNPALALKLKNTKHKTIYSALSPEELEALYKTYPAEKPKPATNSKQHTSDNGQQTTDSRQ